MMYTDPSHPNITVDDEAYYQVTRSVSGVVYKTAFIAKREDLALACEIAFKKDMELMMRCDFIRADIGSPRGSLVAEIFYTDRDSIGTQVIQWDLLPMLLCEKNPNNSY